jgi:hypothetical protein
MKKYCQKMLAIAAFVFAASRGFSSITNVGSEPVLISWTYTVGTYDAYGNMIVLYVEHDGPAWLDAGCTLEDDFGSGEPCTYWYTNNF